jgi:chromosome segregation and condensation protein ScpB
LGAALTALGGEAREKLLSAILETDEPMVLAQLLSFVPRRLRQSIEQRITALTPSEAGSIYSLTEVQTRIEKLLDAGLAAAAEAFIAADEKLSTLGKPPFR